MIKELKTILVIMLLTSLLMDVKAQQNFVFNYDFEFYNLCPDNVGQSNRCVGFFNLVEDVDYSNCNFDITDNHPYYTSDSGAYSGTGFMTMATYGNANGAAESLAQNLQVALDSGFTYDFHIMTKKADSGDFNTNCGGLYLYGFEDIVMGPNWTLCVAGLPGATLLGFTDTVSETVWTGKGFTFVAPFDIKAIAFSPSCAINCLQALFVDSVTISLSVVDIPSMEKESLKIFPVPVNDQLFILTERNYQNSLVEVFDVKGKLIFSDIISSPKEIVNTADWENGVYLIRISSGENVVNRKIIVQH